MTKKELIKVINEVRQWGKQELERESSEGLKDCLIQTLNCFCVI